MNPQLMKRLAAGGLLYALFTAALPACELCAIYSADSARGNSGAGFVFTVAEQYVSSHTLLAEGEEFNAVPFLSRAFVDSSYTHLVPGYNFSSRVGLSLNAPLIHRNFRVTQFLTTGESVDEEGSVSGLGDIALIGRVNLFRKIEMEYTYNVSLLAGVKFPTGDTERLDEEVAAAEQDLAIFGPGHPHSSIGGVHQHDLTLGSGSYDGVFGVTGSARWQRWFFNGQVQYYLRTEARGYQFGDSIIVSGGPGGYILLDKNFTLSLQANAFYESNARDEILGQVSNQTGMTAWYIGPVLSLTFREHFSANAGVDLPLGISNNGLQTVPDYRVRGGFTWRF